jgi:hypothetical protein
MSSEWESFKEAWGGIKGPLGALNKRVRGSSVRVSMTYQVHGDSTKFSLRIPESDFGLFCFLPGNILIHPLERQH